MKEYLFSYGTLQNEKVQIELFGRPLNGTKDILEGYKLTPIEIKDESFLSKGGNKDQLIARSSKNARDTIQGIVFEISEEELLFADKYEPYEYKRIQVALQSGKESWIYVAVET